jgi:transposase
VLSDQVVEVDEMFQNAGEKGILHGDPLDPPRVRGNKRRGHGTFENDRPPVVGVVGRESGQVQLAVVLNTDRMTLEDCVQKAARPGTTANTDEWGAYGHLGALGYVHSIINHSYEYARDDDGDDIREVHINTMEGFWVGVRNYLRRFRGVSKWYLHQYVVLYQSSRNFSHVDQFPFGDVLRRAA